MAAPKIGMKQIFGDAGQAQQVHQLKNKVEELEEEIVKLRVETPNSTEKAALEQQINELREQLIANGGIHEILLDLIDPDPNQPRQTFPENLIQERAESLRRQGQKNPIVLISANSRYNLFDGELRWRSACLLGWKTIKAVILHQEAVNNEIFEGQLITSIHSQKLHDLDLASALIQVISCRYPDFKGRESDIPKMLNTAFRRLQREQKHLELSHIIVANIETQQQWLETASFKEVEEEEIFATLIELQLNPITINNSVFPLLNIAEDLKQAVRTEGIEASKVKELNRLSAKQLNLDNEIALAIRSKATKKVVKEKLSLSEVKTLVNQLIAEHHKQTPAPRSNIINKLVESIQQTKVENIQEEELKVLQNVLKEKLAEIQKILKD